MFAHLLCACPIYTSHRHAHAIALHMRKPLLCTCAGQCLAHARPIALHMRKLLLCTCAPHCFAHARPIIPRTSTIRKHASWTAKKHTNRKSWCTVISIGLVFASCKNNYIPLCLLRRDHNITLHCKPLELEYILDLATYLCLK